MRKTCGAVCGRMHRLIGLCRQNEIYGHMLRIRRAYDGIGAPQLCRFMLAYSRSMRASGKRVCPLLHSCAYDSISTAYTPKPIAHNDLHVRPLAMQLTQAQTSHRCLHHCVARKCFAVLIEFGLTCHQPAAHSPAHNLQYALICGVCPCYAERTFC